MTIDAHQHFWAYDAERYGWIVDAGLDSLKRDFLPADLEPLIASRGLDGTIAVQARQDIEETEWLLDLAERHPWILGVVGWVDLRARDVDDALARLRDRSRRLVGIRHVVQDEPDGFLDDEAFRAGVRRLRDHGLTYDLLIYERQMEEAVRFCATFPDQPIVLDHIGKPCIAEGALEPWATHLRELAAMDHVCCKISGLVTEADHANWTPADLAPFVERTVEAFGADRLMFGSDWPVCTLAADYGRVIDVQRELARESCAAAGRFYGVDAAP